MTKRNGNTATIKNPSKAILQRKAKALAAHAEEHPKCSVTQQHLKKIEDRLSQRYFQEDHA